MSVSQSTGMLSGSLINIDLVKSTPDPRYRRTKIICTLGPACWEVDQLETLISSGMNVARFNFSHGDHEGHGACLERLRTAAKNKGVNVAVMLDTKGPEIRSGFFANGVNKINLKKGQVLTLTSDYSFKGDATKLACSYPSLAKSVSPGQTILVADGSLVLTVLSTDIAASEVSCRIENNASIGERKNMNLPGVVVDLPTLTDKDIHDIQEFGVKNNVDFIAASFVRKGSDVRKIREVLGEQGQGIKIISKIENLEGLQNYDDILAASDAIMVARGDLGMEIPPEKVFLAQKYMIREANIAGKPVVTATQMLESMIVNPRPTRAECSDVANAVLDGTDCVMLSGETANGEHFESAVRIMARTCVEAESAVNYNGLYESIRNSCRERYGCLSKGETIASAAVKTTVDVKAKAIIVLSESGTTARAIAKFRPGVPVCVITLSDRNARQTYGLLKGCYGFKAESLEDTDVIVKDVADELIREKVLIEGDKVVIVCGTAHGQGATNQIKVQTTTFNYWVGDGSNDHKSSASMAGHEGTEHCTIC